MSMVRSARGDGVLLRRRGAHCRPPSPDTLADEEWGEYLFMRKNPRGEHLEQWVHAHGCRRWFNVRRDTVTYRISAVYRVGESPPGK
jgi:sarcosine oxidase subunit delta